MWCRHDGALEVDSFQTLSGRTTNPLEIQANAFAAEFLMPRDGVCELFDDHAPGLDELVTLAAGYGTSALAALIRLESAGLVGEDRAARLRAEIEEGEHFEAMRRLRVERRLKSLLFRSTTDRLGHALLEFAEKYGRRVPGGPAGSRTAAGARPGTAARRP